MFDRVLRDPGEQVSVEESQYLAQRRAIDSLTSLVAKFKRYGKANRP
jgi:hypothetical protein